ncbi:MAG: hypothetical protein V7739_18345 [Motiliproteus sp.]
MKLPPDEFTQQLIAFSTEQLSIAQLEELYAPQEIIDYCLGAIEHLVKDWYEAALTLKELVISSTMEGHKVDYQPLVANSQLGELSKDWLFKAPAARRSAVIYVMGKLSDKKYLPLLDKAFEHYKDTDPFIMERLMFELSWLGDEKFHEKINYLENHENFVFRLTMVEGIQYGAEDGDKDSIKQLERYKNDPHSAVVAAANDDPYYFNLACAACTKSYCDPDSEEYDTYEITLEQFEKWATENAK